MCRRYGVIRTSSLEELILTANFLEKVGPISPPRIGMASISGAGGRAAGGRARAGPGDRGQCAAGGPRGARRRARSLDPRDAAARQLANEAMERLRGTENYREGPRAFLDKRPPVWKGR